MKHQYISKEFLEEEYLTKRLSTKKIAENFGVPYNHIRSLLQKYKIPFRTQGEKRKVYLDEQYVLEQYALGRNRKDIGEELGVSYGPIGAILKKYNITPRLQVYLVNHDFFKTWSRDMAYVLGFVTADGNIAKTKPYLRIELKRTDSIVLEYIRDLISPESKIYEYEHYEKRYDKIHYSSLFSAYSQTIIDDLAKFQVYPNKTGTHLLNFDIPEEFLSHYVRGYFDADGSAYIHKSRKTDMGHPYVKIVCQCREFLVELRRRCGNMGQEIKFGYSHNKNLSDWSFHSKSDVIQFREFIYRDYIFCLERKRAKFYE